MDSPPTSRLRFLNTSGTPIHGPAEWTPALVEVLVDPDIRKQIRLWRQAEPMDTYLKTLAGQERILADWPRSDVGHYQLRLDLLGSTEHLVLTVLPQKLSAQAHTTMLEDLETRLPVSVALALQRAGGLAGVHLPPPGQTTIAQELERLRRAILGSSSRPGLDKVLPEIGKNPHRILRNDELWVQRERTRRPHPARLVQAYTRGYNLDNSGIPLHVVDTRVEHSLDVYENRLVKLYVEQVFRRTRRLLSVLSVGSSTTQLGQVADLLRTLNQARRQAPFLQHVHVPDHLPMQLTMVLAKRPPYRALLEGFLAFHKSVEVQLESPAFDAPLENLPYLYQVWGTLEVLMILLEVAADLGYLLIEEKLVRRVGSSIFVRVLPDGNPAVTLQHPPSKTIVRLIPERSFTKWGSLHSISYTQRPDIAVEVHRPGQTTQLYLFDPKYKLWSEVLYGEKVSTQTTDEDLPEYDPPTPEEPAEQGHGRPKKIDIDKMHAYRDAIRDEQGTRVVQYAAILYPGANMPDYGGIGALRAWPGQAQSLERRLRELLQVALI